MGLTTDGQAGFFSSYTFQQADEHTCQVIDACFPTIGHLNLFVTECGGNSTDYRDALDIANRFAAIDTLNHALLLQKHREHVVACIKHERAPRGYVSAWADHFETLSRLPVAYILTAIEMYPTAVSNWQTVGMTVGIYYEGIPFNYAASLPWDQAYQTPRGYSVDEMARLYRAGVTADFACAAAPSFASVTKIIAMYESGINIEYAIEVFS